MTEIDRIPDWMQPDTNPVGGIDLKAWAQDFRDVYQVTEAICQTPFVPPAMLGKQAQVATAIMKGKELGLTPLDALGCLYVIHGRVGYYAEFMRRRIFDAGHSLRIVENTDSRCIIEATRKGESQPHRATFTAEQARKAGIDLGKYPADKLVARATSRLCRQAFPDVLSGTLIAEDLIDGLIPTDDTAPEPAAPKAALQRKRATRPAKAAATQPAPAAKPDDGDDIAELLGDEPAPEPVAPEPEPEPEPEPVVDRSDELADEPEPALELDEPITPDQLKLLQIRFREHRDFADGDRQARIDYTAGIIKRPITSSKDLTRAEASAVIDSLES